MSGRLSPEQYRAAFIPSGPGFDRYDPDVALIQLGMPTSASLLVWFVPRRGELAELRVELGAVDHNGVALKIDAHEKRVWLAEQGPLRLQLLGLEADRAYRIEASFVERRVEQRRLLHARTAPASGAPAAFSFLSSSCIQPFAQDATETIVTEQTVRGLWLYRRRAQGIAAPAPMFALGLGDQVYVDSGRRAMLEGMRRQRARYERGEADEFFETAYRAQFSVPPLQAAREALPSAMIWDDHEIRDGWGAQQDENTIAGGELRWLEHLGAARRHFVAWQALRNPTRNQAETAFQARALPGSDLTASADLDFETDWGASASFFVMDQRSARSAALARVMSAQQLERLRSWLYRPRSCPTLLALGSAMPITQLRRPLELAEYLVPARWDDLRDSWWSKPCRAQRDQILRMLQDFFRAHPEHRLLILSGDVHFCEVLELSDEGGRIFGHEIVSSGLVHDKHHRFGRGSPRRAKNLAFGLHSAGLGALFGPCFAELFVTPAGSGPPHLELTFHAALTADGAALANPDGDMPQRLELPLSPLAALREDLLGRFVLRPEAGKSPKARAAGFQ
jgi:phosphodiesterase/alkaline phosphatase D-like protein